MLKPLKGSLFVLISALMFASYGFFSRFTESYDVFFQVYVRCFFITIILVIVGLIRKDFKKIDRADLKWFITICSFTIFSVSPILYAFRFLSLGTASFLFYGSTTIFTYILGFLFFKEKLTGIKILVLIIATIGLGLIFSFNFSSAFILPALMALLNGFASSGEVTFTKKVSEKYSNIQLVTTVFAAIGITHMLLSLVLGEVQDFTLLTVKFPVILFWSLGSIAGMYTVVEGYKFLEPSIAAIVGLTEIIFSLILGIMFFSEAIEFNTLVGGILIILAAALPNIIDIYKAKINKIR
ncbi:MAG: DMT family transporter [Candidatus Dojkabacteria bacterium]